MLNYLYSILLFLLCFSVNEIQAEPPSQSLYESYQKNPFDRDAYKAAEQLKKMHRDKLDTENKEKGLELYNQAYLLEPFDPLEAFHLYEEALNYLKDTADAEKVEARLKTCRPPLPSPLPQGERESETE